jgi:hypothetical protein
MLKREHYLKKIIVKRAQNGLENSFLGADVNEGKVVLRTSKFLLFEILLKL